MPVKTWQVDVAAKPGFTPKTVGVVDANPADTVHVLPGDEIQVQLNGRPARGSTRPRPSRSRRQKPVMRARTTIVTTRPRPRRGDPVLVADGERLAGAGLRVLTTVGKGSLPKTVMRPSVTWPRRSPSRPARRSTSCCPATRPPRATRGRPRRSLPTASSSRPVTRRSTDRRHAGRAGTRPCTTRPSAAGSVPLILLLQAPGDAASRGHLHDHGDRAVGRAGETARRRGGRREPAARWRTRRDREVMRACRAVAADARASPTAARG